MPEKSDLFFFDLFGPITVLTDDLIVFQGDIECRDEDRKKHEHDGGFFPPKVAIAGDVEVKIEPRFLNLALSCTPVLLVPFRNYVLSVPLFDIFPSLGTVRINVAKIISVTPFFGQCADDLVKS